LNLKPYLDHIETALHELLVEIPSTQSERLARYCAELEHWNKKVNLTGLSGADLARRLVAEPVWIAKQLNPTGHLLDIGSGNGSPAIPIHIVCQLRTSHLVESRAKRATFLRHAAATLGLKGVEVHKDRFENLNLNNVKMDWITMQAVALTPDLLVAIRRIAHKSTTLAWITADASPPIPPRERLQAPHSRTEVLLFTLDLP
jgi:16S rRNA (guanine527-N7)-methyltransferase